MQTPDHLDIMSRSVQQALHEEICAKLFPQGLGSTSTVDLFDAVSKVAFFATMKSIYGGAEQGFATAAAHQAFLDFDKNFPYLVGGAPMWAFKDSEAGFKKLRALFMDESVYSDTASYIISEREKLYARNNFTDDNRAGFQVALLWGTVSNTMPTTFWCLYFLLGDPAAMKAVRDEVDALTAGLEPSSSQLDGARIFPQSSLNKMAVINSVISETFRITSGSIVIREALEDMELKWKGLGEGKTWNIAKGDKVAMYPPLHHFDESVFGADAATFKYDRFVGEAGVRLERDHLIPFGGGVSQCPGRFFARNEIKSFLATAISCCDFTVSSSNTVGSEFLPSTAIPKMDASRVGLGIFSPQKDVMVDIRAR